MFDSLPVANIASNANSGKSVPGTGAARPTLLFYCQHSLGIGHLTRSFALADALARFFHVVFLNGGRLPAGLPVPPHIELIDMPPLGMDDGHTLVSRGAEQYAWQEPLWVQAARQRRPAPQTHPQDRRHQCRSCRHHRLRGDTRSRQH